MAFISVEGCYAKSLKKRTNSVFDNYLERNWEEKLSLTISLFMASVYTLVVEIS